MQEAIPFRAYIPGAAAGNRRLPVRDPHEDENGNDRRVRVSVSNGRNDYDCVRKLVYENSIIVFGKQGCCMCHVVKRLLLGLGVNPAVIDVDEKEEDYVIEELSAINLDDGEYNDHEVGRLNIQFPVVFVGGKLFGGLERVMATHISGDLVPILKDAGALWL